LRVRLSGEVRRVSRGVPETGPVIAQALPMKAFTFAAIFACLSLGAIAYAQEPPQSTPPSQQAPADAPKVSITGCLTKGATATQYVITEEKTSQQVPFAGPAQLEKYLNQMVQVTGTVVAQGSEKVFKPESINQVSPNCAKGQ
jgi:hypothetical protein